MNRRTLIALSTSLLLTSSYAQNRFCNHVAGFGEYNATTKPHAFPALQIDGCDVVPDSSKTWYLTQRVVSTSQGAGMSSSVYDWFVDTGDSDTRNFGMCAEGIRVFDQGNPGMFWLSRKVIERSVNDSGDCKTMLGTECVKALKKHYQEAAKQYTQKGECPTTDPEIPTTIAWNKTVPEECRGLIGGLEEWPESKLSNMTWVSTGNLTHNLQEVYDQNGCEIEVHDLKNSIHFGGSLGGSYNESIRFPVPTFFTFFPNETSHGIERKLTQVGTPHVEVACLIPGELAEGSIEPPSVEELLNLEGVEWNENATDPKEGN